MNNILNKICEKKKIDLEVKKSKCSFSSLEKIIQNKKNRSFSKLLTKSQNDKKINIIAEIKKASPSAGIIIQDYFPEDIAIEYEKSGVGAISILTEKNFFYGNLDHLSLINKKINIPIIRKDFILDPYEILESKAYNADAILLITSILTDQQIKEFIKLSKEYNLDCLIETHTEEELKRALKIDYQIIGINNRNLKDLSVNLDNTINLIKKIPKDFIVVAESGIKSKSDIMKYIDVGVFNFLIGESILKSSNINNKISELIN